MLLVILSVRKAGRGIVIVLAIKTPDVVENYLALANGLLGLNRFRLFSNLLGCRWLVSFAGWRGFRALARQVSDTENGQQDGHSSYPAFSRPSFAIHSATSRSREY